jgi:hypothetical protein
VHNIFLQQGYHLQYWQPWNHFLDRAGGDELYSERSSEQPNKWAKKNVCNPFFYRKGGKILRLSTQNTKETQASYML